MEEICSAALSLLETQIDLVLAVQELDESSLQEGSWLGLIESKSMALGVSPSLLATQLVSRALQQAEDLEKAHTLLNSLQHMKCGRLFDSNHFISHVLKDYESLPCAILVHLLESNVLPVPALLSRPSTEIVTYLRPAVVKQTPNRSLINGLAGVLLCEGYTADGSVKTKKILLTLVHESFSSSSCSVEYSLLDAARNTASVPEAVLSDFHCEVLMDVLLQPHHLNVYDVMSCQETWSCNQLPPNSAALNAKVIEGAPPDKLLDCIDKTLLQEVNWPALLSFISSFVASSQDAALSVKGFIAGLAGRSVELRETKLLQGTLLLARQAALQGNHVHPSYSTWFKSTFATPATNRKNQEFLLACLSELVPYEPAYCLKAHTAYPLPQFAREAISDYVSLVRTRLQDLSQPVTGATTPLSDGGTSGGAEPPQHVVDDVRSAVEGIVESGSLSEKLLFTSAFRKPYFVGQFLPTLLSPSSTIPDRDTLIAVLWRKGKIPRKMYAAYEQQCKSANLSSSSQAGEGQDPAIARLSDLLHQLAAPGRVGSSGASRLLVSQIANVLGGLEQMNESSTTLTWTSPDLLPLHVELVDAILNTLCEIVLASGSYDNSLQVFLKMFSGHGVLHKAFLVRLWELLTQQVTQLCEGQLTALAGVVCVMWLSQDSAATLNTPHSVVKSFRDYSQCLLQELPMHTQQERESTAAFCCQFVNHYITQQQSNTLELPSTLLSKLGYLHTRMPGLKQSSEVVKMLTEHDQLKELWTKSQVGFSQWLNWELGVTEESLLCPERDAYLRSRLYDHYLPLNFDLGGLGGNLVSAATHLIRVLCVYHCDGGHTAPSRSSYNSLLGLLQTVCVSGSPLKRQEDPAEQTPIITEAIINCLSSDAVQEGCRDNLLLQSVLNVICSVPPWLMFSVCGRTVHSASLTTAAHCLCRIMALSNSYILPSALLYHICKGLNVLSDGVCLYEQFLECSPLFEASLIVNWNTLNTLVPSSISHSDTYSWLQCDVSVPFPQDLRAIVLGVCLYHTLSTGTAEHQQLLWQGLRDFSDCTTKEKLLTVVVDCCARDMRDAAAILELPSHTPVLAIAKTCVGIYPGALSPCSTDPPLHTALLESVRREFPCSNVDTCPLSLFLLWLLVSLPESVLQEVFHFQPSLLSSCLSAHSDCMLQLAQVVEPLFLQQCTRVCEQFIVHCEINIEEATKVNCHSTLKPCLERKLHHCVS